MSAKQQKENQGLCLTLISQQKRHFNTHTYIRYTSTGSFSQKVDSSMENSSIRELPELGMEDPYLFNQWHMSLDELSILPLATENLQHSFSNNYPTAFNLKTSVETSHTGIDRPSKQLKTNSWNSCKTDTADISNLQVDFVPDTLPFASSNDINPVGNVKPKEKAACSRNPIGSQNYVLKGCHGAKRVSTSNRISQAQDHIMAERNRRERLSQKFIALSAIVPGLKKMDKASVLGDAIMYLKQLQEKVKTLEEQIRKKSMESVLFVKKSQLLADIDELSSDENISGPFDVPLPEIEARFCDKSVLVRIHCEKRKGIYEKIMFEIEKCHLTIINSNVMTFGSSTLDITIFGQMDMEFCMTIKDLVKKLRAAF
ncbi:transcription factor bHLH18-like [Durio zibethinus]|uniref:Transcription factor bHLH18-like n=1 Tax=Durio zibethinus TaxID=66656 RepID=A0A6P5Z8R4_DURZI|nr:transcription factor bHLH18-like [Durio zibethinus]